MLHTGIIKNLENIERKINKRLNFSILENLQKSNYCFVDSNSSKNYFKFKSDLEHILHHTDYIQKK